MVSHVYSDPQMCFFQVGRLSKTFPMSAATMWQWLLASEFSHIKPPTTTNNWIVSFLLHKREAICLDAIPYGLPNETQFKHFSPQISQRYRFSSLCGFLCGLLSDKLVWKLSHMVRKCTASRLRGFLCGPTSCISSETHIPYTDMVSRLYGFSCEFSGLMSDYMCSHRRHTNVVSRLCEPSDEFSGLICRCTL